MGARSSRQVRRERNELREDALSRAARALREDWERKNIVADEPGAAVVPYVPPNDFQRNLGAVRIQQLERRGRAFNKADLIALVFRLENRQETELDVLRMQNMTVEDLYAYVRLLLYAPEHSGRAKAPPRPLDHSARENEENIEIIQREGVPSAPVADEITQ